MARVDLDNVRKVARKVERAQAELGEALARARESGETFRDIGEAANLSHQQVQRILLERERDLRQE